MLYLSVYTCDIKGTYQYIIVTKLQALRMFYVCKMKTTETCSRLVPHVQYKHETDPSLHSCLGIYIHIMHLQIYI